MIQAAVAVMAIGAATLLCYAGKIQGEAVTALFGMALALAGLQGQTAAAHQAQPPPTGPVKVTAPDGTTMETNGGHGPPAGPTKEV